MSSRSASGTSGAPRGRVRPLTIVIVVVCALLIVAALSAWRGSESQYGRIPEVRFATSTWNEHAEPYEWASIEDSGGEGVQLVRDISPSQTVTVGLPGELSRTSFSLYVLRDAPDGSTNESVEDVPANSEKTLTIPAETDEGLLGAVVLTTVMPMDIYGDGGEEEILAAEWSLELEPAN